MDMGGAAKTSAILHDYFAPEDADSAYREVARFSQSKQTGRAMDERLVLPDFLRRMAEFEMRGVVVVGGNVCTFVVNAERLPFTIGGNSGVGQSLGKLGDLRSFRADAAPVRPAWRICSTGCLSGGRC